MPALPCWQQDHIVPYVILLMLTFFLCWCQRRQHINLVIEHCKSFHQHIDRKCKKMS